MTDNLLNDALNLVSDEFIVDAKSFSVKKLYLKIASATACVAVIIAVIPAASFFIKGGSDAITMDNDSHISSADTSSEIPEISSLPSEDKEINPAPPPEPTIPVYDSAFFSAKDVAGYFSNALNGGITSYTKVYTPDVKYLYIDPLPTDTYVNIYKTHRKGKPLDESELHAVADDVFQRLQASFGETILEQKVYSYDDSIVIDAETQGYTMSASQYDYQYWYSISAKAIVNNPLGSVYLGGEVITIDQTKSDEEIIASLSSIKQKLFNIFGVSFKNVEIIREYDNYSDYGVSSIYVYFYNEENSDEIILWFENMKNHSSEIVSATNLYNVWIHYRKYRVDDSRTPVAKAKLITLARAEELLKKGYVFGGNGCRLCMREQEPVDFSQYDYVDLEYVSSGNTKKNSEFPFYAFYKYIDISENGNMTYAKTYVPAVEITDLDEYFNEKHTAHTGSADGSSSDSEEYILEDS